MRAHNTSAKVLLVLSVAAIAVMTLTPASDERRRPPFWCVSCGEHVMGDVIRNLVLFMPLGVALGWRRVGMRRAITLGFLLSTVIELLQFGLPGREPSARDILTNSIGTAIGFWITSILADDARTVRSLG